MTAATEGEPTRTAEDATEDLLDATAALEALIVCAAQAPESKEQFEAMSAFLAHGEWLKAHLRAEVMALEEIRA